jgi:hypothetical protein
MATLLADWTPPDLPETPCVHGRPWGLFFHWEAGEGPQPDTAGVELFMAPQCNRCLDARVLTLAESDPPVMVGVDWPFVEEVVEYDAIKNLGFVNDDCWSES